MDTYIKKRNKLVYLGEGQLYSKKDLLLNEVDGANSGSLKNSVNVADGAIQAQKILNNNSTLKDVKVSGDDALSGKRTGNSSDTPLEVNTSQPESIQTAQKMLNALPETQRAQVDVTYFNGNKTQENSSVISRKTLDEMRKNSIPFTKKEMTKFLRSL